MDVGRAVQREQFFTRHALSVKVGRGARGGWGMLSARHVEVRLELTTGARARREMLTR